MFRRYNNFVLHLKKQSMLNKDPVVDASTKEILNLKGLVQSFIDLIIKYFLRIIFIFLNGILFYFIAYLVKNK